jgi:hypothetical protein
VTDVATIVSTGAEGAGVITAGFETGGCEDKAVPLVVVVLFAVVVVAGGVFDFASSGKMRGTTAAQIQRNATDMTIAAKILFSIQGTGSQPPGLKTWQRESRRIPSQPPRRRPYFSMACIIYMEQVGSKRHMGGRIGEMKRL